MLIFIQKFLSAGGGWGSCLYLRLQIWPEGLKADAWDLVFFFYGSALGVWVLYLMAPLNPHKYPYMMSCSLLNFEALQWITPKNGVANLLPLNLDVWSSKWTFFQLIGDVFL